MARVDGWVLLSLLEFVLLLCFSLFRVVAMIYAVAAGILVAFPSANPSTRDMVGFSGLKKSAL